MKLDQYEITHCTCKKCISRCEETPGWFRPSEMSRLAEFLKMPLEEVFRRYLIADFWIGKRGYIYALSPVKDFSRIKSGEEQERVSMQRKHNEFMGRNCDKPGSYASWGYAFIHAPCIFLESGRCKIYPARPFECAVNQHDSKESIKKESIKKESIKGIRELIAGEWKKSKLMDEILGR